MNGKRPLSILTINCGSSSLQISLFELGEDEQHEYLPTHEASLALFFNWLESYRGRFPLDAVEHRVVHGGPRHSQPTRVTPELMATLEDMISLAPEHPPQIAGCR